MTNYPFSHKLIHFIINGFCGWLGIFFFLLLHNAYPDISLSPSSLPPGHPPVQKEGGSPPPLDHLFRGSPDTIREEESLPSGSIVFEIKDVENKSVSQAPVMLHVLSFHNTKKEKYDSLSSQTDMHGECRFDNLRPQSKTFYQISTTKGEATFSSVPFFLKEKGLRGTLHIYPVTSEIERTLLVTQAFFSIELKEDHIEVEEVFSLYNFGRNAWLASNVLLPLPPNFQALLPEEEVEKPKASIIKGEGIRIDGTFGPGKHQIAFQWRTVYSLKEKITLRLLPHLSFLRIVVPAPYRVDFKTDELPSAEHFKDSSGKQLLIVEHQFQKDAPLSHFTFQFIPPAGENLLKLITVNASVIIVGSGFFTGIKNKRKKKKEKRELILTALQKITQDRIDGEIDQAAFKEERDLLIDALARTFHNKNQSV
ncbi:hypothetical protein [Pajaroellobacter abortibovis]|uniref:Uncharacterized protein n=1 Tax=Pajaroellobacter abortibovis TaxID=1882918 RepID=A0A1L6MZH7_9BACT|nr:hypothetical protein [Pajaroellobacter abortibovis]APS00807.1 hypothetical protein BCY86_09045 [Pajaroellobacter abortibovis]